MRKVDRNKVQAPDILTDPNKAGKKETKRAITHFSKPQKANKGKKNTFLFKAYSDITVKDALIDLFEKKCAYCESKMLAVSRGDIEHFRPKGGIKDCDPNEPGYYWLAADWDNLLLACTNCNQQSKHYLPGEPLRKTLGKKNQFPLSDEAYRVRHHTQTIEQEEPYRLLINPCIDDPEDYLEYIEEGVIRAKIGEDGLPIAKGKTSIHVYALQRLDLVTARGELMKCLNAQIQRVKDAIISYDKAKDNNPEDLERLGEIIRRELKYLNEFALSSSPYSGMASQVIKQFKSHITGLE